MLDRPETRQNEMHHQREEDDQRKRPAEVEVDFRHGCAVARLRGFEAAQLRNRVTPQLL
jgi:hypothetical protein